MTELKEQQRPEKLTYYCEKDGDSLTLRLKKPLAGKIFFSCFFAVWTAGWVVIGVTHRDEILSFGGAIIGALTLIGIGMVLTTWFGRRTIRLDYEGLLVEYCFARWSFSRHSPLGEIRYFHAIEEKGSEDVFYYTEAVTYGEPVRISAALEETQWLAYEMNRMLEVLKREPVSVPEAVKDVPVVIAWNSRPQEVAQPGDCRWRRNAETEAAVFERRGASWGDVALCSIAMPFMMGMISVFVMFFFGLLPWTNEAKFLADWNAWVFSSGFFLWAAMMLFFFMGWCSTLFLLLERTRWSFSHGEVICHVTWLGMGRSRCYSLEGCREMVIDLQPREWRWRLPRFREREEKFCIVFVDSRSEELCAMRDLTRDEARWIADNILTYR